MTLSAQRLRETPFAAIDLETTGLSAKSGARVVEISVARVNSDGEPTVVLDTLVDPEGPVLCTSIHGITDDDVVGAPTFSEVLGNLIRALDGALVGAFNASFDMSFIAAEAQRASRHAALRLPPHVCLMWLRPLMGLSKRCSLEAACEHHGLHAGTHRAAEDALACAYMWRHYVDAAERQGITSVSDLECAGSHKYLRSLSWPPYQSDDFQAAGGKLSPTALKPRTRPVIAPTASRQDLEPIAQNSRARTRVYWRALIDALWDNEISESERAVLLETQRTYQLQPAEIRAVHARIFADQLREYAEDLEVSLGETAKIDSLRGALDHLGWAP